MCPWFINACTHILGAPKCWTTCSQKTEQAAVSWQTDNADHFRVQPNFISCPRGVLLTSAQGALGFPSSRRAERSPINPTVLLGNEHGFPSDSRNSTSSVTKSGWTSFRTSPLSVAPSGSRKKPPEHCWFPWLPSPAFSQRRHFICFHTHPHPCIFIFSFTLCNLPPESARTLSALFCRMSSH